MVDKVVGEELSEPMLEARLDVMLEVKLDARGFTAQKTLFWVWNGGGEGHKAGFSFPCI